MVDSSYYVSFIEAARNASTTPITRLLAPIVATATKVQVGLGRASLYCITVTNI